MSTPLPQSHIDAFLLNPDGTPPDLNPDLEPYVETSDKLEGWVNLKHPLVYQIGYTPQLNGLVNRMYEQKQAAVAQAEKEHNWSQLVWLYERPYRIGVFYGIREELTDEQYWHLLSAIWTDTENMWQNAFTWKLCLESDRPGRSENFMDDEDREALAKLPDRLTIYRGSSAGLPPGLSWTLDRDRAEWFARRFEREGHAPILYAGIVYKDDVIGYLTGRNEEEIVVIHEHIRNIEQVTL